MKKGNGQGNTENLKKVRGQHDRLPWFMVSRNLKIIIV